MHDPEESQRGDDELTRLSLASSEVYLTLASLFSKFDLEIFETDVSDIEQYHDFFSPFPVSETRLRVTVS